MMFMLLIIDIIVIGGLMIDSLIVKKNNHIDWTETEINDIVMGFVHNEISDEDMTRWLKCIYDIGMSDMETLFLTKAQLNSGATIDLSTINGIKVDKHSTGGVGDKATLVIAPIVAACGVGVAKMSGRALGHTGGTIDKLESIPGFNTNLTINDFIKQVNDIGLAITGQTTDLAPADKKIYALRDVTGTVNSIPLITASVMSKKLASGADKIVLDVTVGDGAFCKTLEEAKLLATKMVNIGNLYNKETIALVTDMNQPLGKAIGNGVEVQEAIDCLNNQGPSDVTELCLIFASYMVSLSKNISLKQAKQETTAALESGRAYQKFSDLVTAQNGHLNQFKLNYPHHLIIAPKSGYISHIKTADLGYLLIELGGGRKQKDDLIDHQVGIILHKKLGDFVQINEPLISVVSKQQKHIDINKYITISKKKPVTLPLVYEVISH